MITFLEYINEATTDVTYKKNLDKLENLLVGYKFEEEKTITCENEDVKPKQITYRLYLHPSEDRMDSFYFVFFNEKNDTKNKVGFYSRSLKLRTPSENKIKEEINKSISFVTEFEKDYTRNDVYWFSGRNAFSNLLKKVTNYMN